MNKRKQRINEFKNTHEKIISWSQTCVQVEQKDMMVHSRWTNSQLNKVNAHLEEEWMILWRCELTINFTKSSSLFCRNRKTLFRKQLLVRRIQSGILKFEFIENFNARLDIEKNLFRRIQNSKIQQILLFYESYTQLVNIFRIMSFCGKKKSKF